MACSATSTHCTVLFVPTVLVVNLFMWDVELCKITIEDGLKFVSDVALDLNAKHVELFVLDLHGRCATTQFSRNDLGDVAQVTPIGFQTDDG